MLAIARSVQRGIFSYHNSASTAQQEHTHEIGRLQQVNTSLSAAWSGQIDLDQLLRDTLSKALDWCSIVACRGAGKESQSKLLFSVDDIFNESSPLFSRSNEKSLR